MIGAVICTHHTLAQALLEAACMIVGEFPAVEAVSVLPGESMDEIRERLQSAIGNVDHGDGVLVMCDMFGGTPSNLSLSFLKDDVEVITGVNLPMLIKFFTCRTEPLGEVAQMICDHTRENVLVAGALLRRRRGGA
ncbi:MAG: PTS sugar transporter subunit IIA [Bradymonadia bacterium]